MSKSVVEVSIDSVLLGPRFREDLGDVKSLADSMKRVGQLHPILLRSDHTLIAGRRRLEAARLNGWSTVDAIINPTFDDALVALQAERDENECRKEMTVRERVALGEAIEPLVRKAAEQRQREGQKEGGSSGGRGRPKCGNSMRESFPHAKSDRPEASRTRSKVGEAIGMSGRTYQKAKTVTKAAEDDPELFGAIAEEMDRTGKVSRAYRKVKKIMDGLQPESEVSNPTQPANGHSDAKPDRGSGKGVDMAYEAINCLKRIPKNDPSWKRGFQIVKDWIRRTERERK